MKKSYLSFLSFLIFIPFFGISQLTVNNSQTATQLAQILAGPNVTVSNATLTGASTASGSFNGVNSNIGMNSGVILSSGDIANAPGPNNSAGGGDNLGQGGTSETDALAGVTTYDAITLEFDFDVQSDFIQFQYIFASEEYPEYAPPNNSSYNDVFAFYISGPGIVGQENIALVPGTSNPVAINNINTITNNQYYIDNAGGTTVQYDAWTTILTAERQGLTPCNTYHMKLIIADAGDAVWNSAVFLLENSFVQGVVDINTQTVNADNIALEGCIPASFTISLDQPSGTDTQISYQIGGTATNGIDYQQIDTMVTIPAGQTSATVVINSIQDGFAEGQESIFLVFQPTLCSPADTAFLFIDDAQPIQFDLQETNLSCFGSNTGEIQVNATGGFPPYTYHVTTDAGNGTTTQYTNNPVTGLSSGQYSVQVYDTYGCKAEALVIGGLYNAGQTFLPDGSGVSYTSPLTISGFQTGQTLDNISQLQQVCATMEHSYLGDLQIKIISPNGQEVILKEFNGGGSCDLGEPFASGPVDGQNSNLVDTGVGYEYCWNTTPNYGTMVSESNNFTHTIPASTGGTYTDNYLPAGSYSSFENLNGLLGSTLNGDWTIEVTDQFNLDNGYIFNWNIALVSDLPDTLVTITEPNEILIDAFITQAQCGGNDGAINISVTNDNPPFTYQWSNGATTEDISGLSADSYQVIVTNATGCSDSMTFNLSNISSLNITSNVTQVTCAGGTNGAIDISPSGGTPTYTYLWSNGATTQDLTGLTDGTYTLTLTDNNGCVLNEDVIVGTLPVIDITLNNSTNEFCGQQNGSVDINVSGGSGSYGYSWDNGITTQDLSNINQGTYTVTVTDANSCTASNSFTITNDVSNCSAYCYLTLNTNTVTDETCGDGTGAIDLNINNPTNPFVVSWSNGATTEDISGLTSGTYSVTVIDANQCTEIINVTVGNNTGTLAISNPLITNDNCGNGNGSIDITILGGSSPYTYSWSNGITTEDVSGLLAGVYTITITDAGGCTLTQSYTVGNNAPITETAIVQNESCGNSFGSINLSASGGQYPYTYSWSTGATTEDINNLSAGTYNVIITDNVGCQITSADYTVSNSANNMSLSTITVTNEECGNGAGAIDILVVGGITPYTFAWNNGATTEDISGLSAGTYDCTISDANGCQISTGNKIVFNTAGTMNVTTTSLTDEVCGNGTGQIDITVTGGTTPYNFSWDNGANTEDITGLTAGTYVLTATDAGGCSYTYSETVSNNPGTLNLSLTNVINETCGDGTGAIDVTVNSGNTPYTFNWSNGSITEDVSNLNAGTYILNLTDNAGCTSSISATITGTGLDLTSQTISDEFCGNGQGSIDITIVGGTTPYSFNWSNGAISEDLNNLSAGTYILNVSDATGCSLNQSFNINDNTNGLAITAMNVTDENCGDGTGAIDATITGGINPLFYNWDNGVTTEDLTNLNGGTYTLTVTDNLGCTVSQSATVNNISGGFTANITSTTDENCGDGTGTVDLTVTGGQTPYTYTWDNGANTEDISNLNAGSYNVTVTEGNGCSVTLSTAVNNITGSLAITNATVQNESCGNASGFIDLTISGGSTPYIYAWNNGATTEDISGLSAGNYNCEITDNAGCSLTYNGIITDAGGNITTSPVVTNELCGNGQGAIDVTIGGGISPYSYSWTGATPSPCCDYTINMTDQGNSWNGASIDVLVNGVSIGNFTVFGGGTNSGTFTACTGDNVELIWNSGNFDNEVGFELLDPSSNILYTHAQGNAPTPGTIYTFTATCPSAANNVTSVNSLTSGSYDLTITDGVGCTLTETYTIGNSPSPLTFTSVNVTDDMCNQSNGQIDVTVTGGTGFTYTINGNPPPFGPPGTFFNLGADSYLINVTDNNGCSVDSIVTVINNATFITLINSTTDENCGQGNGSIDIDVVGGNNLSYSWSNGETTQDLSNLSAGTYTCSITDGSNGCNDIISATITNLSDITSTSVTIDENCGDGMGAIDLTVIGSATVTYNWDNGSTTEDLTGLSAGTYICTITNTTSNCVMKDTSVINNITTGIAITTLTITDELCGNGQDVIETIASGGTGPYSYSWLNGGTTENNYNLSAGTYTLIATDDNDGCSVSETYIINDNIIFTASGLVSNETCPNCNNGSINVTIIENTPDAPYTFNWDNGATTEDLTNVGAGTYTVTITSNSGCITTLTFTVINDNSTVGISENTNNDILKLYPNPTTNLVNVVYNVNTTDSFIIEVADLQGKIILSKNMANNNGQLQVDVSTLSDGIYFVNLKTNNNIKTVKLIVSK
jgi:subtilisin-like proprotein convertase family protein